MIDSTMIRANGMRIPSMPRTCFAIISFGVIFMPFILLRIVPMKKFMQIAARKICLTLWQRKDIWLILFYFRRYYCR